jgi:biotin-dependent carboxylase-like uncharacterized protein
MTLQVIKAGFYNLLQDYGRFGLQSAGITQGGPLDEHAFLWANHLLDNHYNAAQLEISLGGITARFSKDTMIAICGAEFRVTLNNQPLGLWQSHCVQAGDVIQFAGPKRGAKAYLAVKNGFKVSEHLHSCSTVTREGLGGLHQDGKVLQDDDDLSYETAPKQRRKSVPFQFLPKFPQQITLRFFPNRSETGLSEQGLREFSGQTYLVSSKINRMGFRLNGAAINNVQPGILSQGIALGAIQIPQDGNPIVLMRDRQTMGGYAQAGCVARVDLPFLAQSLPGVAVKFVAAEIEPLAKQWHDVMHYFGIEF